MQIPEKLEECPICGETLSQFDYDLQQHRDHWHTFPSIHVGCPYCHGDGVERIVGWENDVIEQPCSRGCPTPFQRQTSGEA